MTVLALASAIGAIAPPTASPIGYELVRRGSAAFHVVTADLRSGAISAETVHSNGLTSVWNLLAKSKPTAAVTGTFFSPSSQRPVADLLIDGRLVSRGSIGSAIGVGWFGRVKIFDVPYHSPVDWSTYRFGLRGAIRVVSNGVVQPNPKAQKFTDKKLWGKAARTGIGLTKHGKLVLFATRQPVTLSELGKAMKSRGVREGVSLDGGGSTCLYYKGSLVVPPKRLLSNIFVLSVKRDPLAISDPATNRVGER
jgi:exopolysaccharide biosynthesis protein